MLSKREEERYRFTSIAVLFPFSFLGTSTSWKCKWFCIHRFWNLINDSERRKGKTGWAAGKNSLILRCIWLKKSAPVRSRGEVSSTWYIKGPRTTNKGSAGKEAWPKARGFAPTFPCKGTFNRAKGKLTDAQNSWAPSSTSCTATLTGGHFMTTCMTWARPAHLYLSVPTLVSLSKVFWGV